MQWTLEKPTKPLLPVLWSLAGQEIDEIIHFHGYEKVVTAIRDEIYFLPNYTIDKALKFFPELKREEMYCYLNRKDKAYHWI